MTKVFHEWIARLEFDEHRGHVASLLEFTVGTRSVVRKRAASSSLGWHCRASKGFTLLSEVSEQIEQTTAKIRSLQLGVDLRAFGLLLAKVLLPGPLRSTLGSAIRVAAENSQILRLRVDVRDEALRDWPWEFLFFEPDSDSWQGEFLATDPVVSLVRHSAARAPSPECRDGRPVRCLIVWADTDPQTTGLDRAGGLKEILAADTGFRSALARDLEIHYLGGERRASLKHWATRENILASLNAGPWDAVFFVCHGEPNRLLIESPTSLNGEWMAAEELADVLGKAGVQIAMINACGSVGYALSKTTPIVVAMQFPVTLATAVKFWREFFACLALPMPIDLCALAGRQELENLGSTFPDWGTPVMYRGQIAEDATDSTPSATVAKRRVADVVHELARSSATRGPSPNRTSTTLLPELLGYLRGPDAGEVPWPWTPDVIRVFRKTDPWHLLLLASSPAARWPQPIWWTSLRSVPRLLLWPRDPVANRYSIELDDGAIAEPLVFESAENFVPVVADALPNPDGRTFRWTVTSVRADGCREIWVRGILRVLSAADRRILQDSEDLINSQHEELHRHLALAETWIGMQLYDDAIRLLSKLMGRYDNGAEGFIVRRLLGRVFKEIHDRMNFDCHWIGPETALAGGENERWMRLAYCAALGHVHLCEQRDRRGECQSCPDCGIIN